MSNVQQSEEDSDTELENLGGMTERSEGDKTERLPFLSIHKNRSPFKKTEIAKLVIGNQEGSEESTKDSKGLSGGF